MSVAARFTTLCYLLLSLSAIGLGQVNDREATAALAGGAAGYARTSPVNVGPFQPAQLVLGSGTVLDATTGGVVGNTGSTQSNVHSNTSAAGTIDGLDTLTTFDGAFAGQAGPS